VRSPVRTVSPELGDFDEELSEGEEEVRSLTIPDQFGPLAAAVSLSVDLDIAAGVGVMPVSTGGSGVKSGWGKETEYVCQAIGITSRVLSAWAGICSFGNLI